MIYGAPENSTDLFPILDPVNHKATQLKMPVRDPNTPSSKNDPMAPSPYWGAEPIWDSQTSMHNPMMDEQGTGMVHVARRRAGQSGLLQEGLGPSVGEAHPGRAVDPPSLRCTIRRLARSH